MTCDELFDLLTGPYAAEDIQRRDAMKEHLYGCRSCRRLADALEPAVELFRDCSAAEFTSSPAYEGPWREDEQSTYRPAPRAVSAPYVFHPAPGGSMSSLLEIFGSDVLRLAAAILIGLTLGALVWGQSEAKPAPSSGSLAMSAPPDYSATAGLARVTLASLRIMPSCLPAEHRPVYSADAAQRPRPAAELLAATNLDALACCTSCHASLGMASHSKSATLQVVQSCQACHTFGG